LPSLTLLTLALVGFVAGFVDAIAGGGGLATLPALALAGLDPVSAVATNKLAGTLGVGSATYAFVRAGRVHWRADAPAAALAFLGSVLGALCLPYAPKELLVALMPILLIAVALYFAFARAARDEPLHAPQPRRSLAAALSVGFYDGVFGPGAGTFYMLGFMRFGGRRLIDSLPLARLANFGSNFGALLVYALTGHILVAAGLAMGAGNLVGAHIGARVAMAVGARIVRPLVVVMSLALAARLLTLPDAPMRVWVESLLACSPL